MLGILLIPLQLAATVTATRYESTTETDMGSAPPRVTRTATTVGGGVVRIEVLEGLRPRDPSAQSYMLLRIKDSKTYSINSTKQEYSEIDVSKMQAQIISAIKAVGGSMTFSGINYSVEDLGGGLTILGHPTRHWRMTQAMSINTVLGADSTLAATESTSDLYFATDLTLPNHSAAAVDTSSLAQFQGLTPDLELAKARAQLSRLPKTLLLRSITKGMTRTAGVETTTASTTSLTKIETVEIPVSFLEVPSTYKKIDMFPLSKPDLQR